MRWQDSNTTTNEEWYMYDASGQRILRRSQTGTGNSNTKYTITVFGLEDHIYDGGGTSLNNKYYYALAGHLIGVLNNSGTNFLFTDALGRVVSTISTTANSASVGGNQVYGPYGNNPYSKGTMGTTKGYTGQYNDSLTQLDYYGARYYDPMVGVFLSADEVQGNPEGMNPYNYVGENPQTNTDPGGQMYAPPPGSQPQGNPPPYSPPSNPWTGPLNGNTSNVQPDTCTQMSQAGNSCQVAAGVQVSTVVSPVDRGSNGSSITVGCGIFTGIAAVCTGFSSVPDGSQNVEIQSTLPFRICLPTIVCSDHGGNSEGGSGGGHSLENVLASDAGGGELSDLGDSGSEGNGNSNDFNPPADRHFYSKLNLKTVAKAKNSVVIPGIDVNGDVEAINAGEVEQVNGTYTVNGRTYGVHNGTLYPISGDGVYPLDRGAFKALGVYKMFGITERTQFILNEMKMTDAAIQAALEVHRAAEGQE